jgi:hypothetical protein
MTNTQPYLSTTGATHFFRERGFPVAPGTLAKYRCVGGGPHFVRFGRKPFYAQQWLEEWLTGKLSREVASTSEAA